MRGAGGRGEECAQEGRVQVIVLFRGQASPHKSCANLGKMLFLLVPPFLRP